MAHQERSSRYEVSRSWQSRNPDVDRMLCDPALREAIERLEGRTRHHTRSSSRQPRPTPSRSQPTSDQSQAVSRPLGYSNLRHFNEGRVLQYQIERHLREDQRSGPYDAVQSVGGRSDYERRERLVYYDSEGRHRRRYEDEQYELYDDGRSDNYY